MGQEEQKRELTTGRTGGSRTRTVQSLSVAEWAGFQKGGNNGPTHRDQHMQRCGHHNCIWCQTARTQTQWRAATRLARQKGQTVKVPAHGLGTLFCIQPMGLGALRSFHVVRMCVCSGHPGLTVGCRTWLGKNKVRHRDSCGSHASNAREEVKHSSAQAVSSMLTLSLRTLTHLIKCVELPPEQKCWPGACP